MRFYEKLCDELMDKIPEKKLAELPRGYLALGDIMIIHLERSLYKYKTEIGNACLKLLPYMRTVLLEKRIRGRMRRPEIEVIAGERRTKTIFKEHGCEFLIDFSKVMWSGGNKAERQRLVSIAKRGEVIVDMFAGIGYWSIFLAKYCEPKIIYAIDINKDAIELLKTNAQLNNVSDKFEIHEGDCRKIVPKMNLKADRIIMGYLDRTERFLKYIKSIVKPGTIIHLHRNVFEHESIEERILKVLARNGIEAEIMDARVVKSVAPRVYHKVFDIKVKKC